MPHRILRRVLTTALTVLILAFIFGNSAADGEQSSGLSLAVLGWLNGVLRQMKLPLELSHHFVRKLAHFTEYSLLGASLVVTVSSWRKRKWRFIAVWLPLLCGAATAALDETLQTFVSGRCGCFADAALDFSGVLWAALAASFIMTAKAKAARKDG